MLASGQVYAWGNKESGQTGILLPSEVKTNKENKDEGQDAATNSNKNSEIENSNNNKEEEKFDHMKPNKIGPSRVLDIFTGREHSFMLVNNRFTSLRGWGLNNYGQLGIGNNENTSYPTKAEFFNKIKIKSVTGGDHHSLVLTNKNEIYAWGKNDEGQCGIISDEKKEETLIISKPTKVFIKDDADVNGSNSKFNKINTSMNFNYALTKDNKAYSWGFGDSAVLGNKKDSSEIIPYNINSNFFFNRTIEEVILNFKYKIDIVRCSTCCCRIA